MKVLSKATVAQNILKNKSEDIESQAEASILINILENTLREYQQQILCVSAPEVNLLKKIAIIRTDDTKINLINPKVTKQEEPILSLRESCVSFETYHNCIRFNKITIVNGFKGEVLELEGELAILAQHAIDHLNGITYHERSVKVAVVRQDGKILKRDFCVCGSKKRFEECCEIKDEDRQI